MPLRGRGDYLFEVDVQGGMSVAMRLQHRGIEARLLAGAGPTRVLAVDGTIVEDVVTELVGRWCPTARRIT